MICRGIASLTLHFVLNAVCQCTWQLWGFFWVVLHSGQVLSHYFTNTLLHDGWFKPGIFEELATRQDVSFSPNVNFNFSVFNKDHPMWHKCSCSGILKLATALNPPWKLLVLKNPHSHMSPLCPTNTESSVLSIAVVWRYRIQKYYE